MVTEESPEYQQHWHIRGQIVLMALLHDPLNSFLGLCCFIKKFVSLILGHIAGILAAYVSP